MSVVVFSEPAERQRQRRRLRWRARRGLLENDVLIERFLDRYETTLDDDQVNALAQLLDLSDNDLFDLLLARTEPTDSLDTRAVRDLLALMRAV